MSRPLHTISTWAATLSVAAFIAVSPARSAPVDECTAYSGYATTDSTQQCLVNGSATLIAFPGGDAVIPPGYQLGYVLTSTNGLTIEQVGPDPVFTVSTVNVWRIHALVYDPATLDFNAILDLDDLYQLYHMLIQGGGSICASLNTGGAGTKTTICGEPCSADAGTISALNPDQCLADGEAQLEATPDGNTVVPDGFSVLHVLTTGPDLLILATGPEPSFTVTFEGPFTIHTLVYDPATLDLSGIVPGETSAFEIFALLQQGGGPVCGDIDMGGAEFQVADCNPTCDAFAGTLTAVEGEVCLVDGIADLDATPNGDAVVPDGYSIAYILARANGVIENVEPITLFEWPLTGEYVIHTLVYDPFTIDPYEVTLGVTTIEEINSALIQGGGPVCGSLDLIGAPITVIDCEPVCEAAAGTLTAVESEVCRVDGIALLEATPNGDAVVPAAYSVAYILARANGIIENVEPNSDFEWPLLGSYVIHTLVYDPATLNPFTVVLGVTNVSSINAQLIQGGGTICGSLDLDGAAFSVIDCEPVCEAAAGTLTAVESEVCRVDGIALLEAMPNGDAVVPAGYSVAYILARANGIIENVEPNSDFEWPLLGSYVIHTLVYDPATLNPFTVVLGVTNVSSINAQLIQGGGSICGSLDLDGAAFSVIDCAPPCDEYAGVGGDRVLCFTDPVTDLFSLLTDAPDAGGSWSGPDGQTFGGSFDPATDAQGVYIYYVTDGPDCPGDTTQLVISLIECANDCEADAGTLSNADPEVCLQGGSAFLSADVNGDIVIPAGYISAYLLSSGPELTLIAFENAPLFIVNAAGTYTIHTVVYDFTTWDLSGITWGTTTVSEVAALFIQGGGNVCANIDVAGAQFLVSECVDPCAGTAGEDVSVEICNDGLVTALFPLLGGSPLPGGTWFSTALNEPLFDGFYDSMTSQGGTYGYVVSAGPDCPNDTAYVVVTEIECTDPCAGSTPDAGIGGDIIRCTIDPEVWLFDLLQGTPDVGGTWTGPNGSFSTGFFDPLTDQPGVYVYTVFDLLDCEPDTTQLNISVVDCPQGQQQQATWPNPSTTQVSVRFPTVLSGGASIDLLDALGRSVRPMITVNGDLVIVDVSGMPAGTYTLRAIDGRSAYAGRFTRAKD